MTEHEKIEKVKNVVRFYDLKKRCNQQEYSFPRFYLCNFLRLNTTIPLKRMASILGYKEHDQVIYGAKMHNIFVKTRDERYMELTFHLESQLKDTIESINVTSVMNELTMLSTYKQI